MVAVDPALASVVDSLKSGLFNPQEPGIFDSIIAAMLSPEDPWMTFADFRSYIDAQARVGDLWRDQAGWVQMSIRNVAASGFFSTDRTMQEYNEDIWKLTPVVP